MTHQKPDKLGALALFQSFEIFTQCFTMMFLVNLCVIIFSLVLILLLVIEFRQNLWSLARHGSW